MLTKVAVMDSLNRDMTDTVGFFIQYMAWIIVYSPNCHLQDTF